MGLLLTLVVSGLFSFGISERFVWNFSNCKNHTTNHQIKLVCTKISRATTSLFFTPFYLWALHRGQIFITRVIWFLFFSLLAERKKSQSLTIILSISTQSLKLVLIDWLRVCNIIIGRNGKSSGINGFGMSSWCHLNYWIIQSPFKQIALMCDTLLKYSNWTFLHAQNWKRDRDSNTYSDIRCWSLFNPPEFMLKTQFTTLFICDFHFRKKILRLIFTLSITVKNIQFFFSRHHRK